MQKKITKADSKSFRHLIPKIANHKMDFIVSTINVFCNTKFFYILSEKPMEGNSLIPMASHSLSASVREFVLK